jgi:Family of unknown function (DUF6082)
VKGRRNWRPNREFRIAGIPALALIGSALILASPLALAWVGRVHTDWPLLGNVGQAYGGMSALISGIALLGVVASLVIQRRQHYLDANAFIRQRQSELFGLIREDPHLYWPLLGADIDDPDAVRRHTFRVEWFTYLLAGFESGYYSEDELRHEAFPALFRRERNRNYWERASGHWRMQIKTRGAQSFVRIADEELAVASATGPGLEDPMRRNDRRDGLAATAVILLGVAGVGALAGAYAASRRGVGRPRNHG